MIDSLCGEYLVSTDLVICKTGSVLLKSNFSILGGGPGGRER